MLQLLLNFKIIIQQMPFTKSDGFLVGLKLCERNNYREGNIFHKIRREY